MLRRIMLILCCVSEGFIKKKKGGGSSPLWTDSQVSPLFGLESFPNCVNKDLPCLLLIFFSTKIRVVLHQHLAGVAESLNVQKCYQGRIKI